MFRPLPLPPDVPTLLVPGRGLSREQLVVAGARDVHIARLVRRGVLVRVGRGRYRVPLGPGAPQIRTDRAWELHHLTLLEAVQRRFPDAVVCGRSAAVALGYPVWRRPDQPELIRHPEFGRPSGVRWTSRHPRLW